MSTKQIISLPSRNGGSIPMEKKVEAVARWGVKGENPKNIIAEIYQDLDKDPIPKDASTKIKQWRKQLQAALDRNDAYVEKLAEKAGILSDGEDKSTKKATAKAASK
jgi:hypothetical protein